MNFLPNKAHLGINAALFVAYHASKDNPISGAAIARHYNLGSRSLEPVLQTLGNAGLLQSVRGQAGGYYIDSPDKISVRDIITCFISRLLPECSAFSEFSPVLTKFTEKNYELFLNNMSEVTIKDLCDDSTENKLPKLQKDILLFEI
ncbi:MAG: RrF2 family transcriptional regulator [Alphaproteobacteria bacterium]